MSANPKKLRAPKPEAEPVKALSVVERAAQALTITQTEDQLRELAQASTSLTVITNPAGLDQVHGARMVLKNTRIEIEKKGKAAREDANAFSKAVIAKEKELIGIIQPEEARLQSIQDAYEAEQKRIKDEQIAQEQRRVARHMAKLEAMKVLPAQHARSLSAEITDAIDELLSSPITEIQWEEFTEVAFATRADTLNKLKDLGEEALNREAAAAAEKAEREAEAKRMADERAELDRRKAEQDRKDREAQAQRDADAAAIRKQREDFERQQREAEAARQAEADRVAAERKKLEEEQAEFRRQQQEAADRAEAAKKAAEASPPEPEPPAPIAPAEPAPLPLAAYDGVNVGGGEVAVVEVGNDQRPLLTWPAVPERPDDNLIIGCIANEWDVSLATALRWITEVAARRAA